MGKERVKQNTIEPGYYQINMGGLSVGECWRITRAPLEFLAMLVSKVAGKKTEDYHWLPSYEACRYCELTEFGKRAQRMLAAEAKIASFFGFKQGKFANYGRRLGTHAQEAGSYTALHEDRKRILVISCIRTRNEAANITVEDLTYGIFFYRTTDQYQVCIHNQWSYVDGVGSGKSVYMATTDLLTIAEQAEKELAACDYPVQTFSDVVEFDKLMRPLHDASWLYRINRGLMVRVPEDHFVYLWDRKKWQTLRT